MSIHEYGADADFTYKDEHRADFTYEHEYGANF